MRTDRLESTTPELDEAEASWWDRFSVVAERLWAFDEETALALREPYIAAAAAFLETSSGPRVLDLGCGSGFLSRLLAERHARVVGADVSEAQVALARAAARDHPQGDRMEFHVRDANALASEAQRFDAVVGHAFLHHLATDELEQLVEQIAGLLVEGGRAWFYEPVFFPPGRPTPAGVAQFVLARLCDIAGRLMTILKAVDPQPGDAGRRFTQEADRLGYFLSPKEIPFRADELESVLAEHLEIERIGWTTGASYSCAIWVANLRRARLRRILAKRLVRPLSRLDVWLGRRGSLELYRGLPGYGFAVSECRRRAG